MIMFSSEEDFLEFLKKNHKSTNTIPNSGARIIEIEITNEIKSSINEIIGLTNPPVNIEENPL